METQMLTQVANYNGFIGEVFSRMHIMPLRNSAELRCTLSGGTGFLKQALNTLSENKNWIASESMLLGEFKKIFLDSHGPFIRINLKEAIKILNLSILTMSDRAKIVKNEILDSKDFRDFREILFMLEANYELLKLIESKLTKSKIGEQDVLNLVTISSSLIKSYFFIMGNKGITKEDLKESLLNVQSVWRHYHVLSEIEERWQIS